ncbi:hypothetical protein ACFLZ8_05360 [Planctomycetota bacterium]
MKIDTNSLVKNKKELISVSLLGLSILLAILMLLKINNLLAYTTVCHQQNWHRLTPWVSGGLKVFSYMQENT